MKLDGPSSSPYVLVVVALDECDDKINTRTIVQLLAETRSLEKVQLRIFLTSGPEVPIRHGLGEVPHAERQDFVLHNISPITVNQDIRLLLEHEFRRIAQDYRLYDWPGGEAITKLVQYASGLFIWAATTCRFIQEGAKRRIIQNRLRTILDNSRSISKPEEHLNMIYVTVLASSIPVTITEKEKRGLYLQLRYIQGSIVTLLSPLSIFSLGSLISRDDIVSIEDIEDILDSLHAILNIPKNQASPLRIHHPSSRDFLLDKQRCNNVEFWVNEKQAHASLVHNCIRLMSSSLKQDICSLDAPGIHIVEVERSRLERYLPPELKYPAL